jgi:hypothetical protein
MAVSFSGTPDSFEDRADEEKGQRVASMAAEFKKSHQEEILW